MRAENAFPKAEEVDRSAQSLQSPDETRQKANLEAAAWKANQSGLSAKAEMTKGCDGLDKYTDVPRQRSQQAAAAYEAVEKPEQKVSVDALV